MIKIHPNREAVLDTMIDALYNRKGEISKIFMTPFQVNEFHTQKTTQAQFQAFEESMKQRSLLDRIKERFSGKSIVPDNLTKKVSQIKNLCVLENRRINAQGVKFEEKEVQDLGQLLDSSRAESFGGEMASLFDRCGRQTFKALSEANTRHRVDNKDFEKAMKIALTKEYKDILGSEKSDLAELVASQEFANYSGNTFYVPYPGTFGAGLHVGLDKSRGNKYQPVTSGRVGWQKNLLEVERVENFTVSNQNLGNVYIVKSEFSPTSYAIKDKWAPIYEYFTRDKEVNFTRIGSGKYNEQTGKMQTIISTEGKDVSDLLKLGQPNKIEHEKKLVQYYNLKIMIILAKQLMLQERISNKL